MSTRNVYANNSAIVNYCVIVYSERASMRNIGRCLREHANVSRIRTGTCVYAKQCSRCLCETKPARAGYQNVCSIRPMSCDHARI
jgi:hypothetical protein